MNPLKRWSMVFISVIFISVLMLCFLQWFFNLPNETRTNIFYNADFTSDDQGWSSQDASWLQSYDNRQGIVKLSRKQFVAPYLMKKFSLKENSPNSFVARLSVRVSSFSEDLTTIASLLFPLNNLTIVLNEERRLGITTGMFDPPTYSSTIFAKLTSDRWHEIYVWFNGQDKEVVLYLDKKEVLSLPWDNETYPLEEMWLGSIWIKGPYNYGVPTEISYDNITIAGEELLPIPSFGEYLGQRLLKIWETLIPTFWQQKLVVPL